MGKAICKGAMGKGNGNRQRANDMRNKNRAAAFQSRRLAQFVCFHHIYFGRQAKAPPPEASDAESNRYVVSTGSRACAGCCCLLPL
jgi:hypothetical protein